MCWWADYLDGKRRQRLAVVCAGDLSLRIRQGNRRAMIARAK
jgi:hypothetical protein